MGKGQKQVRTHDGFMEPKKRRGTIKRKKAQRRKRGEYYYDPSEY